MIDGGEVVLADLGGERRHRVLVLSNRNFHRLADRAIVAPEYEGPVDDVAAPWRVEADGAIFAIDLVRSLPLDRLLDAVGSAGVVEARRAQRALRALLS